MNLKKTNYGREGTVFCKLRGSEIEIRIMDDEVTEEYAEKCVEAMNHMSDEMIEVICQAAKAYCLKCMALAGDDFEGDMTIPVTSETPAREILKCFMPVALIIEKPRDNARTGYQLECSCDWEMKRGMEIDILDDKVVYLGRLASGSPWYEHKQSEMNFVYYDKEKITQEVTVMINGETVKINALMVFRSRSPMADQYNVNFREAGSKRGVRLYCQDWEEAAALAQNIREGKVSDLTGYRAEWNGWN